ncbi:hypothetical protein E1B28_010691 [Marasmius oreades]|uniref:DUF6534 domain-containing protein n=1 Tax=Marasmius oreades TaxID=181124 RepID=A0A9P7RYA7_9AGAR|nr:uncharacterized protein E1B28_010691 [Marasmius oreades]KAG7091672.1 hypothetical protein E1B28_010691 [Marasmius oreades]
MSSTAGENRIYIASIGAMTIGLLLASFLGGFTTLQTALYFGSHKGDHWAHRLSIAFLWILAVGQLAFIFHATYFYVITKGINFPDAVELTWSLKLQIFMQTIIMSATKVLYTVRIWNLQKDKKKWIPIALSAVLVVEYGLGTFFAYEVTTIPDLKSTRFIDFRYSVFLAMSFNTLTDILVAAALIYTIVKSRPNLGWTYSSWTMLMAYTMNTGTITGFFSLIVLVGFIFGVANPLYIVAEMVLPQLYVNCFLSMINSSFYFQTQSSLDISISYRSRRPSGISSTSRFHGNDLESLSMHRMSDSLGSIDDYSKVALATGEGTINEVGLPLFERKESRKPEVPLKKIPVEVQVQTTKTEYTIDRRMLYNAMYQTSSVDTGSR